MGTITANMGSGSTLSANLGGGNVITADIGDGSTLTAKMGEGATAPGYQYETLILVDRFTGTPTQTHVDLIDDTFVSLKAAGILELADLLYFRNVFDEQASKQNWAQDKFNSDYTDTVFTAGEGVKGNGTTAYIDNNYIASEDAVNFDERECTVAIMDSEITTINGRYSFGVYNSAVPRAYFQMLSYHSIDEFMYFNSNATNQNGNMPVNVLLGYTKEYDYGVQAYEDGIAQGAAVIASTSKGLFRNSLVELARSVNGVPGGFSDEERSFFFLGDLLTPTQMASLSTIVHNFRTNVAATLAGDAWTPVSIPDPPSGRIYTADEIEEGQITLNIINSSRG